MSERVKANFVDHISIAVKDVARAEEQFKKTFGWEVSGRYTDSGLLHHRTYSVLAEVMDGNY